MKVSVVIATYGEDYWRDLANGGALASVLPQKPHEIGLYHDPDGTLAEVRNKAAATASGEWLCFLDADDQLGVGYLDAMAKAEADVLREPNTGVLVEDALLAPALALGLRSPELPNRHAPIEEVNHCPIGTLVSHDLFDRVGGFRDDFPIYEDWELFLRCVRAGARIIDVPDAVYRAEERVGSRNAARSRKVYEQIRAEHLAAA